MKHDYDMWDLTPEVRTEILDVMEDYITQFCVTEWPFEKIMFKKRLYEIRPVTWWVEKFSAPEYTIDFGDTVCEILRASDSDVNSARRLSKSGITLFVSGKPVHLIFTSYCWEDDLLTIVLTKT